MWQGFTGRAIFLLLMIPLYGCRHNIGGIVNIGDIVSSPQTYIGKELMVKGRVDRTFDLFIGSVFRAKDNTGVTIQPSPEMTTNFRIQRIGPVTLNSFHPLNSLLYPVQRKPDLSSYTQDLYGFCLKSVIDFRSLTPNLSFCSSLKGLHHLGLPHALKLRKSESSICS